jgi:hypothetical protein
MPRDLPSANGAGGSRPTTRQGQGQSSQAAPWGQLVAHAAHISSISLAGASCKVQGVFQCQVIDDIWIDLATLLFILVGYNAKCI